VTMLAHIITKWSVLWQWSIQWTTTITIP